MSNLSKREYFKFYIKEKLSKAGIKFISVVMTLVFISLLIILIYIPYEYLYGYARIITVILTFFIGFMAFAISSSAVYYSRSLNTEYIPYVSRIKNLSSNDDFDALEEWLGVIRSNDKKAILEYMELNNIH